MSDIRMRSSQQEKFERPDARRGGALKTSASITASATKDARAPDASYAIVIAALNEAATIRDIAARALRHVREVIVIDDGSTDATAAAVAGLPLTLIAHTKNLGKAASLKHGFEHALAGGATAIITLDGDGQHDPDEIPRLIELHEAQSGAIVVGSRLLQRSSIPRPRYLANRFANFWIAWAAGHPIADSQSGFRVYPAAVLRAVLDRCDTRASFTFESEILIEAGRHGYTSIALPVQAIYPPRARPSHFRPVADIALIVRMIAWKLISRGFCLPGLIRSLRRPKKASSDPDRRSVG